MTRNALTRGLAAAAMIAAASGLLAGCGGNSSTASGKPSVSATVSAPAAAPAAPSAGGQSGEQNSGGINPSPTALPPTAPPETPEPVPSGFPGPTPAPRSDKDQAYLDQLNKQGIKTGDNGDVALQTAGYICGATKEKTPPQQIQAIVGAIAESQAKLVGQKIDRQKAAQTYISVAKSVYCNG